MPPLARSAGAPMPAAGRGSRESRSGWRRPGRRQGRTLLLASGRAPRRIARGRGGRRHRRGVPARDADQAGGETGACAVLQSEHLIEPAVDHDGVQNHAGLDLDDPRRDPQLVTEALETTGHHPRRAEPARETTRRRLVAQDTCIEAGAVQRVEQRPPANDGEPAHPFSIGGDRLGDADADPVVGRMPRDVRERQDDHGARAGGRRRRHLNAARDALGGRDAGDAGDTDQHEPCRVQAHPRRQQSVRLHDRFLRRATGTPPRRVPEAQTPVDT